MHDASEDRLLAVLERPARRMFASYVLRARARTHTHTHTHIHIHIHIHIHTRPIPSPPPPFCRGPIISSRSIKPHPPSAPGILGLPRRSEMVAWRQAEWQRGGGRSTTRVSPRHQCSGHHPPAPRRESETLTRSACPLVVVTEAPWAPRLPHPCCGPGTAVTLPSLPPGLSITSRNLILGRFIIHCKRLGP